MTLHFIGGPPRRWRRPAGWRIAVHLFWILAVSRGAAESFVLIDAQHVGHGPYALATGTPVLAGRFTLDPRAGSISLRAGGDTEAILGPFTFTNHASLTIEDQVYRVMLTTPDFHTAHAAGQQTRAMREAVQTARSNEDARAGVALIESALAANTHFRNRQAVTNVLKELALRIAREEAKRTAGQVQFEGRWMSSAQAEALRQTREDEAKRAQGLEKIDGEWLTLEAARERRMEKAKAEAQRLAAERRRHEANQCRRCKGTGSIYFEIRPRPTLANTRDGGRQLPDLRVEKPGLPPPDAKIETERSTCPACNGTGQRR